MIDVYWLEQTEADIPAKNDWLSPNEAVRLNGMRFAKRRADWRGARPPPNGALVPYPTSDSSLGAHFLEAIQHRFGIASYGRHGAHLDRSRAYAAPPC